MYCTCISYVDDVLLCSLYTLILPPPPPSPPTNQTFPHTLVMADISADTVAALFRPSKKQRRIYRQPVTESESATASTSSLPGPEPSPATASDCSPPIADGTPISDNLSLPPVAPDDCDQDRVFRVRAKPRSQGIAFRSGPLSLAAAAVQTAPSASDTVTGNELVLHDVDQISVPARFTAATGLTTELHTRHM